MGESSSPRFSYSGEEGGGVGSAAENTGGILEGGVGTGVAVGSGDEEGGGAGVSVGPGVLSAAEELPWEEDPAEEDPAAELLPTEEEELLPGVLQAHKSSKNTAIRAAVRRR